MYKDKFGFLFVICVWLNNKDVILIGIRVCLFNDLYEELKSGIEEVKKIMFFRIKDLIECEDFKL